MLRAMKTNDLEQYLSSGVAQEKSIEELRAENEHLRKQVERKRLQDENEQLRRILRGEGRIWF